MPALLQTRRVVLSKRPKMLQPLATLFAPYNNLIAFGPGDSRTAQGGGLSGTYNASDGVRNAYGQGVDAFLTTMLGNRARFADNQPGIGGSTAVGASSYPRPVTNTANTGRIDSGTAGTPGNTLTITTKAGGDGFAVGERITASGMTPATIIALGTGTGTTGTYTIDGPPQSVASTATIQPYYVYGSGGKTIADIAANPAAIIILGPLGTNNSGDPTELAAMATIIKGLTDPTYVYPGYGAVLPLYNGQPKTIILLNDTRTGYSTSGSASQGKTPTSLALQFYNYSLSLLKYGFDSGDALANPHVIAVDTFNDPVLADLTDTTNYAVKPGFFADGLHFAPPAAYQVATRIAAKVAPLLTTYARARCRRA